MEKQEVELKQRRAVREYLKQYSTAKNQKRILENRHRELRRELVAPALGSAFRSMPTSKSRKTEGAVSVVYRIAEVETRIEQQRQEMAKAVLHVMDLVDLLLPNSMERQVVELRYIDCKGWDKISGEVHMSRSSIFEHHNAALEKIAGNKRAQKLIAEYAEKCQQPERTPME